MIDDKPFTENFSDWAPLLLVKAQFLNSRTKDQKVRGIKSYHILKK